MEEITSNNIDASPSLGRNELRDKFNDQKIPHKGLNRDQIYKQLEEFKKKDVQLDTNKILCLVYQLDHEHEEYLKKVYNLYFEENYLNPTVFKSIKNIEEKILNMVKPLFNAPTDAVGSVTSGGTESILLAVKTYKAMGKKIKKIKKPNMIVPRSIHVAFEKAANYFDVEFRIIDIDEDFKVNKEKLLKAIDKNTIMVALSAPQYPHGSIDPIEELSGILYEKNIPLHVDACVGGFILPWIEKLGVEIPHWNFSLKGVTSISADFHKYGFVAPKGSSLLIYRSMEFLKHQFFISTDWPGGVYVSPTIPGSRPGGAIATTYATLLSLGEEKYLELTRQSLKAKEILIDHINKRDDLYIIGNPLTTCMSIGCKDKDIDIFAVGDQMNEKGWHFDRIQNPNGIHLTIMPNHLKVMDQFIADLIDSANNVKNNPDLKYSGNAPMYGMMAKVPFRKMVKENVLKVVEEMYSSNPVDPEESSKKNNNFITKLILKIFN